MRVLTILLAIAALTACAGCGDRPVVLQGVVVSYDGNASLVVVRDETPPSPEITLSLAGADVGAVPVPGDVVRLAYREEGAVRQAIRVMNLTRQAELGTKSAGAH